MDIDEVKDQLFPEPDKYLLEAKALVGIVSGLRTEDVYIVWFAKTLGNWKALLSTDVEPGLYFEATHNGAKNETYIDSYRKYANICIPGSVIPAVLENPLGAHPEVTSGFEEEPEKTSTPVMSPLYETVAEAEAVLAGMQRELDLYGYCSMASLLTMSGIYAKFDDNKYGWKSLEGIQFERSGMKYKLTLTPVVSII